jgi:hypothetical protein
LGILTRDGGKTQRGLPQWKVVEIGSNNEAADATSSTPATKAKKTTPSGDGSHVGASLTGRQGQLREINMQADIGIAHLLAYGI